MNNFRPSSSAICSMKGGPQDQAAGTEPDAPTEGMIPDFITGQPVKETEKEKVRQEVARQLIFEYQIAPEHMLADFPVKVEGKRKNVDIAIFEHGKEHNLESLRRAVICRPFPNVGKKAVIKIRDYAQAEKDLEELKGVMIAAEGCEWGLWTNGLERFFLRKEKRRFEVRFAPHGDWPMADGTMSTPDVHAANYVRPGDENALRRAFQRCHNFIHGNEGMPKDAAFWQFLYLIFAKMYDERSNKGKDCKFFAFADEPFSEEGRMKIRGRINDLFRAMKKHYGFFRDSDEITLSDRALAYMVMELARYNFSRSDVDAKGAAYQEIVGANLRGDRGQYFTPRRAVNLVVRILDPKEKEKVFDPACGTGGFLVATLAHQLRRFRAEFKREIGDKTTDSILGNPGDEYIRRWILRHCWVLACVEVPVEAFIVEANVGILTSLLFLKKKTETEMDAEAQGHAKEYPIFMAVAERAGVDRRGNALYKRKPTFDNLDAALGATQVFPEKVSSLVSGLPDGFDAWVESMCCFDDSKRPSATEALSGFDLLFSPPPPSTSESTPEPPPPGTPLDYTNLLSGTLLKGKYQVESALGKGGFGRVYKVIDTFGDVTRALKIITVDRSSTAERMKQEYRTLANLPEHPGVVRVYDGDFLEGDRVPFLIMEYVEGANVGELISDKRISVAEAHRMGIGVAEGLAHHHRHRVTHGDIKPANLMWTSKAVKIVDFNVSMRAGDFAARGGGTRRYLPPDLDFNLDPGDAERMDRDIYALGITLYEAVTGNYPWLNSNFPPANQTARDPRTISGFEDLAPSLVSVLMKSIAPTRAERYTSAEELVQALRKLSVL